MRLSFNARKTCNFTLSAARLLVVDDIPGNLKVTGDLLALYNAEVDTCRSGQEAIKLVKQNDYDLIFMDHLMPGMDGVETVAEIRSWEQERQKKKISGCTPPPPQNFANKYQ